MENSGFEKVFLKSVQSVPTNNNENRRNGYKIATFGLVGAIVALLVLFLVMLLSIKMPECECEECSEEKPIGDYSVVKDGDGKIVELLMICKTDDGRTMELMDDNRYTERDSEANYLDYGFYSVVEGDDVILELSTDRVDKYVYFDGRSLVNMNKVYHCLHDEEE